jgi:hypothetical protein
MYYWIIGDVLTILGQLLALVTQALDREKEPVPKLDFVRWTDRKMMSLVVLPLELDSFLRPKTGLDIGNDKCFRLSGEVPVRGCYVIKSASNVSQGDVLAYIREACVTFNYFDP